jgi:hypothetical protein
MTNVRCVSFRARSGKSFWGSSANPAGFSFACESESTGLKSHFGSLHRRLVIDILRCKKFYVGALAPVGYQMIREYGITSTRPAESAGFGELRRARSLDLLGQAESGGHAHCLCGQVPRTTNCGKDKGRSNPRPRYSVNYYDALAQPDNQNRERMVKKPNN